VIYFFLPAFFGAAFFAAGFLALDLTLAAMMFPFCCVVLFFLQKFFLQVIPSCSQSGDL
jgi:hypothetical protein